MNGSIIRDIRKTQNLTQFQLAQLSGVTQSAISGIENGEKKNPTIDTIEKIAKALGVDLSTLVDQEKNEE